MEYLSLNTISTRFWSYILTSDYPGSMDLLERIVILDHPSSSNFADSSLEYLTVGALGGDAGEYPRSRFLVPVDFDEQERTYKQ
jgi:hypothetical protein